MRHGGKAAMALCCIRNCIQITLNELLKYTVIFFNEILMDGIG